MSTSSDSKATFKTNSRTRPSQRVPSTPGSSFSYVFPVLAALVGFVIAYFYFIGGNSVLNLENASESSLRRVLFSDKPFLFYCRKGSEQIPSVFNEALGLSGNKFGFAVLNCSQTLPSGKTIFDRFKLQKDWKTVIFSSSPWGKPKQADPVHFTDAKKLVNFVHKYQSPKSKVLRFTGELSSFCSFNEHDESEISSIRNTCIMLVKGSKFSKSHSDMEEKLIRQFPKAKIGSMDASQYRLSFEDAKNEPHDSFGMKVFALRGGQHFQVMEEMLTSDYLFNFVTKMTAQPLSVYKKSNSPIKINKINSIFKDRSQRQEKTEKKEKKSSSSSKKREREEENDFEGNREEESFDASDERFEEPVEKEKNTARKSQEQSASFDDEDIIEL